MPVNVKTASRRELHFNTLDDILRDAETITQAPHRTTGNWTAAQILQHVAFTITLGSRGIDIPIPLPMKLFGRTLKLFGQHVKPMKPGIRPPGKVGQAFRPPEDITLADAMTMLRDEVAYAHQHGMPHPSPLFGKLDPDEWVQMQCRHAEMHMGFIHPAV